MLQFLRFDKAKVKESEYNIISGNESFKFFAKRVGYVFILLYSTIFIGAIDPFWESSYEPWVYYIGGVISGTIILRLLNHIVKYIKYRGGKIAIGTEMIKVFHRDGECNISEQSIKYIEVNAFGNLVIREDEKLTSFPLVLLKEDDRATLLSLFQDISPKRTEFYKKVREFFEALLVAFILAMHIREYIIQAYYIPSGSMEDTLLIGDHLLVEKITYGPIIPKMIGMGGDLKLDFIGLRDVRRGDIVVFRPPHEKKRDFIKRCIAVAGDELHIKDNSVYINGKKIDESYTKGLTSYDNFREEMIEGVVPDGRVVVLGDNRENSSDSREFGYLDIKRIKGRAFVLYWNTRQIRNLDFSRYGLIR